MPNNDEFPISVEFPQVEYSDAGAQLPFLLHVIIHEIAHNIDQTDDFYYRWRVHHKLYQNSILEIYRLCFYECDAASDFLKPAETNNLYHRLYDTTDWMTLYSGSEGEDFADSFALFVLVKKISQRADYKIKLPNGAEYSVKALMNSEIYKEKIAMLEEILTTLPKNIVPFVELKNRPLLRY